VADGVSDARVDKAYKIFLKYADVSSPKEAMVENGREIQFRYIQRIYRGRKSTLTRIQTAAHSLTSAHLAGQDWVEECGLAGIPLPIP
jgi:hypothetical protein